MVQIVEDLTLDALNVLGQLLDGGRLGRGGGCHPCGGRLAAVGPRVDRHLIAGRAGTRDGRPPRASRLDPFQLGAGPGAQRWRRWRRLVALNNQIRSSLDSYCYGIGLRMMLNCI